jgi:hypothetical protein
MEADILCKMLPVGYCHIFTSPMIGIFYAALQYPCSDRLDNWHNFSNSCPRSTQNDKERPGPYNMCYVQDTRPEWPAGRIQFATRYERNLRHISQNFNCSSRRNRAADYSNIEWIEQKSTLLGSRWTIALPAAIWCGHLQAWISEGSSWADCIFDAPEPGHVNVIRGAFRPLWKRYQVEKQGDAIG